MRASQVVALLVAVSSISTAASNDQQMMKAHVGKGVPTRKVKVYQFMLPEKNIWTISKGNKKMCTGGPYTNWYAESQTDCKLPAGSYTITCCDTRAKEGWTGGYVMIQGKKQKLCKKFDWGANKECYTQKFSLVIPTPKPTPVPTPVPTPTPTLIGTSLITIWNGWHFWAVDTDSTSDAGVKAACLAKGFSIPCAGRATCLYSNTPTCTLTSETGCGSPTNGDLARFLTCQNANYLCKPLANVFSYMGDKWGGNAYGCRFTKGGRYMGCYRGKANMAGKALCIGK